MNSDALFGLYVSLGVLGGLAFLALIVSLIVRFKEKFGRNFFLTGTAWGLFLGGVLFTWGLILWMDSATAVDANPLVELLTFQVMGNPAASWLFYWGLIILLITWITNIRKSSFWWGTFQNIVQGVVVLALSVIIAIGALLWAEKTKKR